MRLWIAVLGRAADDLKSRRTLIRDDAAEWFLSTAVELNSFEGICSLLGADPGAVREAVLHRGGMDGDWRSFKP